MAALFFAAPLAVHPPRRAVSAERAAEIARGTRLAAPFLVYLVLITFAPVYHGVRVLATRHAPEQLRTPFHTALHLAAIAASLGMLVLGFSTGRYVYAALSPIGFLIGLGDLGFARTTLSVTDDLVVRAHEVDDRRRSCVSHRVLRPRRGTPVRDLHGRLPGRSALAPADDHRLPGKRDLGPVLSPQVRGHLHRDSHASTVRGGQSSRDSPG